MSKLSPQARALIDEARCAEGLTGARRARMRGALVTQLGAGAAVSTGAAVGAAGTAGKVAGGAAFALGTALKVVATVAIVGGAGAGGLAVAAHGMPHVELPRLGHVAPPSPRPLPIVLSPSPAVTPDGPLTAANVPIARPAAATGFVSAATVSAAASSLESETRLLRDASFELRAGRPDRALALLDEHTRSFSRGALIEERGVERILALCALGRAAEAQAEGASFLRERPRSLLADRVRASCGHAPEGSDEP